MIRDGRERNKLPAGADKNILFGCPGSLCPHDRLSMLCPQAMLHLRTRVSLVVERALLSTVRRMHM